jgi:hypothetical protein
MKKVTRPLGKLSPIWSAVTTAVSVTKEPNDVVPFEPGDGVDFVCVVICRTSKHSLSPVEPPNSVKVPG